MTDEELADVLALLRTTWSAPPTMPDGSPAAYRLMVGQLPLPVVMVGLGRCAEVEPKWRPSPAELRAACTASERTAYVSADEAWALVERAVRMIPGGTQDPEFPERHQAAIDWLRERDEPTAAWAARRGLRGPGSLGAEPVGDPDHGGATRHRLNAERGDVIRLAQERVQLGGSAFVARDFLARGGATAGGMGELIERLRPVSVAALEAGEAA